MNRFGYFETLRNIKKIEKLRLLTKFRECVMLKSGGGSEV